MTGKQQQTPRREGWLITGVGTKWKAIRAQELTTWELAYGCRSVVLAGSLGELEMLLTAEQVKRDMIDLAARLMQGMREADAQRGQG